MSRDKRNQNKSPLQIWTLQQKHWVSKAALHLPSEKEEEEEEMGKREATRFWFGGNNSLNSNLISLKTVGDFMLYFFLVYFLSDIFLITVYIMLLLIAVFAYGKWVVEFRNGHYELGGKILYIGTESVLEVTDLGNKCKWANCYVIYSLYAVYVNICLWIHITRAGTCKGLRVKTPYQQLKPIFLQNEMVGIDSLGVF